MILFLADNHFGARPGFELAGALRARFPLEFHEDDLSVLGQPTLADRYTLVVLHLIGGTGSVPLAGADVEQGLRRYLKAGRPLLLLHGASAAFWHWEWWRHLVGLRWVRPGDPDGVPASVHPVRPFQVRVSKTRHPLCQVLRDFEVKAEGDEIYIQLEQVCPVWVLMETDTDEGTFPQAYACTSPWGGAILGFLPGHRPEVVTDPALVHNVTVMIESLTTGTAVPPNRTLV